MEKRNEFSIKFSDGKQKLVKRISLEEGEKYNQLGCGMGDSLEYCAWMGTRYCQDFLDRVAFFAIKSELDTIGEDGSKVYAIATMFFEDKLNNQKEVIT